MIKANVKRKKLLDFDVHTEGEGDSEPKSAVKHIKKLRKAGNKITNSKAMTSLILISCLML